jgi:Zn-finger nucleic acid-binding protein
MDCPRCKTELRDVRHIFVCLGCGGAFLPSTAQAAVARALDPVAQKTAALAGVRGTAAVDTAARTPCPLCTKAMGRFRVGGVDVDNCAAHGSWYDRGELEVVADALAAGQGGVPVSPPSLDVVERPRLPPPAPSSSQASSTPMVDPGAARAISKLMKHEKKEERRHQRRHARGETSAAHDVADFIGDLIE